MNALLEEDIAPTAQLEATFTVGDFYDAPEPKVVVRFGEPNADSLEITPEEFRTYTINDPTYSAILRRVRRVEFGLPNPLLKRFRLLDTPGLGSIHRADSDNTLITLGVGGFLDAEEERRLEKVLSHVGRTATDLHTDTVQAIDGADAVVYLFDRALNEHDASVVARFLGPLAPSLSALKVVGVLSRCDQSYWPPVDMDDVDPVAYDPLAVARRIVDRYLEHPVTRRMFFRIMPVAALAAAGTSALDERRLGWLDELGKMEPPNLARALADANRFARATEIKGVDLPRDARTTLISEIGAWGTMKASLYRRDGVNGQELARLMQTDSGVSHVRRTLMEHFGNRSAALKLDQALRDISSQITKLRMDAVRSESTIPAVVGTVAGIVERIRLDDTEMSELTVLEDYYRGHLELNAQDADEILRVNGEYGRTVAARLGLPDDTPIVKLIAVADHRASAWMNRSEIFGLDGTTAAAARQIALSYGRLSFRIRTAHRLLQWDDEWDGQD